MAMPSTQEIQEQIRRSQQLVGMDASSQQYPYYPVAAGGNYTSYGSQPPFPVANFQGNTPPKTVPVTMGKLSLLSISFSLMLLGAFTFLGGFLLGIWVTGSRNPQPLATYPVAQQAVPYYPTATPYPQGAGSQSISHHLGSALEEGLKEPQFHGVPAMLSPLVKAAQAEVAKQIGTTTEDFLQQQLRTVPAPLPQTPVAAPPTYPAAAPSVPYPSQLPVITPQNQAPEYVVQLGTYASLENATDLMNRLQALNQQTQLLEGKASDGSKVYYVHSGHYKDYQTALSAAQRAAQNVPGAIVVRSSQQHPNPL